MIWRAASWLGARLLRFSPLSWLGSLIGPYIMPALLAGLALSLAALWIQSDRLSRSDEKITALRKEIAGLKSAAILTERLREDNANLVGELADLRKELNAAKSYEHPLPDDIRRIARRMRDARPGAGPAVSPR